MSSILGTQAPGKLLHWSKNNVAPNTQTTLVVPAAGFYLAVYQVVVCVSDAVTLSVDTEVVPVRFNAGNNIYLRVLNGLNAIWTCPPEDPLIGDVGELFEAHRSATNATGNISITTFYRTFKP